MKKALKILCLEPKVYLTAGQFLSLGCIPGLEIVDACRSQKEALAVVKKSKPDILLTPPTFARFPALDLVEGVGKVLPLCRIIVLRTQPYGCRNGLWRSLGTTGCLRTALPEDEFAAQVRKLANGEILDCPTLSETPKLCGTTLAKSGRFKLTRREKDILKAVALGLSNRETARKLKISVRTAEVHRANLAAKLEIHSPAGLTRFAITVGLICP